MIERSVRISAVATSFKKMVQGGTFYISDVREAAKLLKCQISTEQESFLSILSCVKFADMPLDVKEQLQHTLEDIFSSEAFEIEVGKTFLGRTKTKRLRIA